MSPDKRKLKVIGSYTFSCVGVSETKVAPLLKLERVGVNLTVYEDGHRELGCAYLNKETHDCMADEEGGTRQCCYLYPARARYVNKERIIRSDDNPDTLSDWSKFRPNSQN